MKKPIIIGFDPGTTAAVAVIDTKKNILLLKSKKGMKKSEVVEYVTEIGEPLIVAGDKYPLPKAVEKLGSMLGCKTSHPPEFLSNAEKWELVGEFTEKTENEHERDALASALKAYEKYSKLFTKADRILSYLGLIGYYSRVLEMIILEEVDNLTDAINKILGEIRSRKELVIKTQKPTKEIKTAEVVKLGKKLKQKESDISILKKYNESLKKKVKEAEDKIIYYQKIQAEKLDLGSIKDMKEKIDSLRRKLTEKSSLVEKLKLLRRLELDGYIPILELEETKLSKLEDLNQTIGLENRVISVDDLKNVRIFNDYGIKAIISKKEPDEKILKSVSFPIIPEKEISVKKKDNLLAVEQGEFEKRLKEARKTGVIEWLKGHKERRL